MTIQDQQDGWSFVFSFPFLLYTDSKRAPTVSEIKIDKIKYRIYPPFRAGPANFVPMPPVPGEVVPTLPEASGTLNGIIRGPAAMYSFPKFPGESDTRMQTEPDPQWQTVPEYWPMDAMRIDVFSQAPKSSLPVKGPNPTIFLTTFLEELRALTKQWWIGKSMDVIAGRTRKEFPINHFGAPLTRPSEVVFGRSMVGDEIVITSEIWTAALKNVETSNKTSVVLEYVLDARYMAAAENTRMSILYSAAACEISIENTLEVLARRRNPDTKVKRGQYFSAYDLPTNLLKLCKEFGLKDPTIECPYLYRDLSKIWFARGEAAHGKAARYLEDGTWATINHELAFSLSVSALKLTNWLEDQAR